MFRSLAVEGPCVAQYQFLRGLVELRSGHPRGPTPASEVLSGLGETTAKPPSIQELRNAVPNAVSAREVMCGIAFGSGGAKAAAGRSPAPSASLRCLRYTQPDIFWSPFWNVMPTQSPCTLLAVSLVPTGTVATISRLTLTGASVGRDDGSAGRNLLVGSFRNNGREKRDG